MKVVAAGGLDTDELDGFGPGAKRAVARAEEQACRLGHDRVGTEHLLLGVLADDEADGGDASAAAATVLHDAGVTLTTARHKVREATAGSSSAPGTGAAPLPRTARADRALARSMRFAHEHRSTIVDSEHLLLGVLDVEGTAGQVLRGLGVDIDQLRAALLSAESQRPAAPLDDGAPPEAAGAAATTETTPVARCPSCLTPLGREVAYHSVAASGEHGPRTAIVFSCTACGTALGVTPSALVTHRPGTRDRK